MSSFNVGDRVQYKTWPDNPATILEIGVANEVLLEFDTPSYRFHNAGGIGKTNCCWYGSARNCTHLDATLLLQAKHSKVISKIKYLDKKFKERKQLEKDLYEIFA